MPEDLKGVLGRFEKLYIAAKDKIAETKKAQEWERARDDSWEKLSNEAAQYSLLMTDPRYFRVRDYLEELVRILQKNLAWVCSTAKTKDEMILLSARISAQIELLEGLMSRPEQIVKEARAVEKQRERSLKTKLR